LPSSNMRASGAIVDMVVRGMTPLA